MMRLPARSAHAESDAAIEPALPSGLIPAPAPPQPGGEPAPPGTRTYRGRSLDELLPRIEAELGPHAVIVREREGLMGGMGGFFQKRFVEVEAVSGGIPAYDGYDGDPAAPGPHGGDRPAAAVGPAAYASARGVADDGGDPSASLLTEAASFVAQLTHAQQAPDAVPAALERSAMPGLAAAETRAAIDRADFAPGARAGTARPMAPDHPFADEIAPRPAGPAAMPEPRRAADDADEFDDLDGPHAAGPDDGSGPAPDPRGGPDAGRADDAGLHGEPLDDAGRLTTSGAAAGHEPDTSGAATAGAVGLPAPAARALKVLVASGMSEAMAADVVGEAVAHRAPFAPSRRLKGIVRDALAARLPVAGPTGAGRRVVAFVGTSGAGKTHAAARLAAAYAAGSDLPVFCIALAPRDSGAGLAAAMAGAGVAPIVAATADDALAAIGEVPDHGVVVVDAPAFRPRDADGTRALAEELTALGVTERHLVVPVTLSARSVRELMAGAAPIGPTALALTRTDETDYLGAGLELAAQSGTPVSWIAWGADAPGGLEPATPDGLAAMVLS